MSTTREARPRDRANLEERVHETVRSAAPELARLSHEIHAHQKAVP